MKTTSKGFDQTAPMHKLISDFAGRTYHVVGNLMSQLKCTFSKVEAYLIISHKVEA